MKIPKIWERRLAGNGTLSQREYIEVHKHTMYSTQIWRTKMVCLGFWIFHVNGQKFIEVRYRLGLSGSWASYLCVTLLDTTTVSVYCTVLYPGNVTRAGGWRLTGGRIVIQYCNRGDQSIRAGDGRAQRMKSPWRKSKMPSTRPGTVPGDGTGSS